MIETIQFRLNGKPMSLPVDSDRMLLWILRTDLALTGTKYGCGESLCEACTVLIDNEAVRSCNTSMKEVHGKEVITIEGLAGNGKPHPLQEAFMGQDAMQCGYCTPGMILNAYALLLKIPRPSEAQVIEGMNDNLCRCGAHQRIIQAIMAAAEKMGGNSHAG
jgi:aerobic-type carbon monoxide dehydrogenase small subunit (CoxS/CutS family)